MLGDLSKKYESNGDPGCISTGWGDAGGKSYGMYQLSSNMGIVRDFTSWLIRRGCWFGDALAVEPVGSKQFDDTWITLATEHKDEFSRWQHDYIEDLYYDVAVKALEQNYFNINKHSYTMQDVIWSRAVQYGPGRIVEMFVEAVNKLGYPNLSYVDDKRFDADLIGAIYDVCATPEWTSGSLALREGLYNRFAAEKEEAWKRLELEK